MIQINWKEKKYRLKIIAFISLIIFSLAAVFLVSNNEGFYQRPIAKIISISETYTRQAKDMYGNSEQVCTQEIKAVLMNGVHKGEEIRLSNNATESQVFDTKYEVKDKVFISYKEDAQRKIISAGILELKRDSYLVNILIIFIFLIILIGGGKGIRSLASVAVNILISWFLIEMLVKRFNAILITSVAGVLFILLSILLVNGINSKSYAAICGTIAGTLFTLVITLSVIAATDGRGIYYDEMDFLSYNSAQLFIIEIIIGTLGGIIDIAVTISSAIKEIYDKNPHIDRKLLVRSGKEIGKDIMGTMANILVFAYISG
ncbi:MAG: YibE/F family protein, partial [Eubacterium sp.]|nr:YibE/F family protein [Eubacterium sp.]